MTQYTHPKPWHDESWAGENKVKQQMVSAGAGILGNGSPQTQSGNNTQAAAINLMCDPDPPLPRDPVLN